MNKINSFFLVFLILFNLQAIMGTHLLKKTRTGYRTDVNPLTGESVSYGCLKGKCWAFCEPENQTWCYTNAKQGQGNKPCSGDSDCDKSFYVCQGACGV